MIFLDVMWFLMWFYNSTIVTLSRCKDLIGDNVISSVVMRFASWLCDFLGGYVIFSSYMISSLVIWLPRWLHRFPKDIITNHNNNNENNLKNKSICYNNSTRNNHATTT